MRPRLGMIAVVVAGAASVAGIAIGDTTGPAGTISVCKAADGTMRLLARATDRCNAGESHLDFPAGGVTGVRGPRGPQGPAGFSIPGPAGPRGADATSRPLPLTDHGPLRLVSQTVTLVHNPPNDDFSSNLHVLGMSCPSGGTAINGWAAGDAQYHDPHGGVAWTAVIAKLSEPTAASADGVLPGGWEFLWEPHWVPTIPVFSLTAKFYVECYDESGVVQPSAPPAPGTGGGVPVGGGGSGTNTGTAVAPTATADPSGAVSTVLTGTPAEHGSLLLLWSGQNGSGGHAFVAAANGGSRVIGQGAFRIGRSGRAKTKLQLNAFGRKLLNKQGEIVAQLRISARQGNGTAVKSIAILPIRRHGFRPPRPPKGSLSTGLGAVYSQRPESRKRLSGGP